VVENQIHGPFFFSYKQAIYMMLMPGMIRDDVQTVKPTTARGPKGEYVVPWMKSLSLVSGVENIDLV